MKREAIIEVKGEQLINGDDSDSIGLVTRGLFYEKGKNTYLVYDESPITGLPDTKTTVRISDTGVSVARSGKCPSNLLFEIDKRNVTLYTTPFGQMQMSVSTHTIDWRKQGDSAQLKVVYSLGVEDNHVGKNNIEINVKLLKTEEI